MKITIEPKDGQWDITVERSDGKIYVVTRKTQIDVVNWLLCHFEITIDPVLRMME